MLELPEAGVKARYTSGVELMQLVKGRRTWKRDNLELRKGLPLFVYSPSSQVYWYRVLGEDHDMNKYRSYIKEGNLYIFFDQQWQEIVQQERETEKMGYYDYNKIRHLILLGEVLDATKEGRPDYQSKKRAIQIEIEKVTQKYKN